MRVTIILGAFFPIPPINGGAVEKRWFAMAKEMVRQGHDVTIICKNHPLTPIKSEIVSGILIERVKGFCFTKYQILLKIYDFIYTVLALKKVSVESDIIISNTFFFPIIASKSIKKKLLVDVARMPKGQIKLYIKSKYIRGNSSSVVSAIKRELSYDYYSKIVHIPNPLPYSVVKKDTNKLKSNKILYVGRIHKEKGIDIMINAFKILNLENYELHIVGSHDITNGGSGESYLKYLKNLCNSMPNIYFRGGIYNLEELANEYLESKIFIYPSISEIGETFGLAPLEAMSYGCVPVVSDLSCFKDFIQHNYNGLIFNHREKQKEVNLSIQIKKLIQDRVFFDNLSKKATEVNDSHSINKITKQFVDLYENSLSNK